MAACTFAWRHPLLTSLAVSLPATVAASLALARLEREVALVPPPLNSPLRVPNDHPAQRVADIEHWVVRVPLRTLVRAASSSSCPTMSMGEADLHALAHTWLQAYLCTPSVRLQARLMGEPAPPAEEGGARVFERGQLLVGGLLELTDVPAPSCSSADQCSSARDAVLHARWHAPRELVAFFERAAAWGYPWRLLSGGRHSWEVALLSSGGSTAGEEQEVELRFGCAHDYEPVGAKDGGDDGKKMPPLVLWAHRVFARVLVQQAVREVRRLARGEAETSG
ncbi:hypothetical protein JCM10449v2_005694 [Rhodotorula kratochvilovae]